MVEKELQEAKARIRELEAELEVEKRALEMAAGVVARFSDHHNTAEYFRTEAGIDIAVMQRTNE